MRNKRSERKSAIKEAIPTSVSCLLTFNFCFHVVVHHFRLKHCLGRFEKWLQPFAALTLQSKGKKKCLRVLNGCIQMYTTGPEIYFTTDHDDCIIAQTPHKTLLICLKYERLFPPLKNCHPITRDFELRRQNTEKITQNVHLCSWNFELVSWIQVVTGMNDWMCFLSLYVQLNYSVSPLGTFHLLLLGSK